MGCVFRLGIAQRKRLRSVKNRSAILFWGVRQDARRSKMTVPFERLGLRLLDCEVFFALHFSQPAGASFGWAWHRQRFFLRELTARYAPNARFASFGRDNRDYMARIARDARPRLGFASQTRTFGAYLAFDSRNDAHCASILPARNAGKWDLSLFSRQAPSTELPLISRIQEMRGSSVLEVFLFAGKLYLGK